jgi:hypothetical protein
VGRRGALGLFEMREAGEMTGTHIVVVEHDDMSGHGRFTDAVMADQEARKILEAVRGDKPPVDLISSGVYAEIPILG